MSTNRSLKPTFAQWMAQFAEENTSRGELARYIARTIQGTADPRFITTRTLTLWESRFRTFGADKALFDELKDALMAFGCIYPFPRWKTPDEFMRCYRHLDGFKQDPSIPGHCIYGHAENCARVSKELGCTCSWSRCPNGGEWRPKEALVAYCRPVKGPYEYDLVVDCCPICGGQHEHGGGSAKGNPADFLGSRCSHCQYGGDVWREYELRFQEDSHV